MKNIKHPAWFIKKAYLFMRSNQILRPEDIILANFPKTGSTWIRYFLYNLLCQRNDYLSPSFDDMNRYMPEFGNLSMLNNWAFTEAPRLIKTHKPYNFCFRKNRVILVIRDPRDIVVSYYHYAKNMKTNPFAGTLHDVILHPKMGIEAFMRHFASWEKRAGLIIKYEDLKYEPVKYFASIASYIGVTTDINRIKRAVEDSSFSSMRQAQKESKVLKKNFREDFNFVRSGKSGQWKDMFHEKDIKFYIDQSIQYGFTYYK